jgi:hypothetical protein
VAECKSKWACLRNSFARALREEKSKKSGSAASRKKKWYLFEEMSFLSSFMMQHKQTLSNLEASDDESEATDTEKSTENTDVNESINEIENESTNTTSLIDRQELVSSEPVFKKPKKTQTKNSAAEQVAGPMIEFLRSKTNKSSVEDVDLLFFKSLLPDLKKLNGKNQRQFKQFVLTTLNSYIDSQEAQESASNDKVSYSSTTSHVPVQEFQTYNYTFSPLGYSSSNSSTY